MSGAIGSGLGLLLVLVKFFVQRAGMKAEAVEAFLKAVEVIESERLKGPKYSELEDDAMKKAKEKLDSQ